MSNPIINPLWIYLIDVAGSIITVAVTLMVLLGVGLVFGATFYIMWRVNEYYEDDDDDVRDNKLFLRLLKRGAIAFALSALLVTFIPSEKTMYTMFAASYITEENVELTGDAIKDTVDYIFEKVDELGE